jgi:hypothetical protein
MLSKENNMQGRYTIFTSEENQGLETILGNYPNHEHKYLGNTPEAIAGSLKELRISNKDEIFYSSSMEFGTEVGFKTDESPIELFNKACKVYSNLLTSNQ